MLIVTAPLWFKAPFKVLRLFVREKLRDRVYTVSLSEVCVQIEDLLFMKILRKLCIIVHGFLLFLLLIVSFFILPSLLMKLEMHLLFFKNLCSIFLLEFLKTIC